VSDQPTALGRWTQRVRGLISADELRTLADRSPELLLLATLTGAVTGAAVALFDRAVVNGLLDHIFKLSPWLLAFAPLCGLAFAAASLRWLGRRASPSSADLYLQAFHSSSKPIVLREVPARMLAAISTLGFGGVMGLEGPSLYLGSSIGVFLQRRLRRLSRRLDRRVLLVAGAAAGVAAIFKAPATGAVFALEVPFQDDLAHRMLLPALVGSATSYLSFVAINGTGPLFGVRGTPPFTFVDLVGALAIGVLAGLGARAFSALMRLGKRLSEKDHPIRIIGAGLTIAALFGIGEALTGKPIVIGVGYSTIDWALMANRAIWLLLVILLLRCLATAATVTGGGVGGLFIPLVVAGALLGRAVGAVVGDVDNTLFLVLGVAAFLGAGYRVPLAAVTFVAETTGRPGFVVPGLLAAVAAELMMGRWSVTTFQRAPAPPPGTTNTSPASQD
jgi:CIC family chloride channel protein